MKADEMSIAEAAAEVVRLAVKAKVVSTEISFSRVTDGGTECGAWRVKVERIAPPPNHDPGRPYQQNGETE